MRTRSGNGIHFTAGPGAGNSMTVSLANNVLTFRDTAATIAAGTTCTSVNANTVTCPATGVNALYLDGADGNDVFNQTAAIATRFVGGTGNDSFRGGPLSDSYYGNDGDDIVTAAATMDGADLFAGGDGSDSMVYSARTTRVAITLDGLRNDGQDADGDGSGEEGDYVRADVERVTGGAGNDVLRGSDVGNVLRGGPGADTLSGGIGRDQHYGEAGTDTIVSRDGNADTATCGTEADTVVADATGVDVVAADCETVSRD